MRFFVEELERKGEKTGVKRGGVVPSTEGGVFVIEGDVFVGRLHANRAVGRIGLSGLSDETLLSLQAGETDSSEFFEYNLNTGIITAKSEVGLIAQVQDNIASVTEPGLWKTINSFREFAPAVSFVE